MSDQITYLPLSALRESPFNPRKTFDDAGLAELAESIQAQGVLQPLVVRPLPEAQADIAWRYELVFGHRRLRACAILPEYREGTLGVPCIVREMDDQDAAIAQVSENMQRADVSPLEEADALARLHREHNLGAELIGRRIGKSRSYVYNRIKLATACDAVRHAVTSEGLPAELAVEVARLRGEALQTAALKRIKDYGDEWQSYRTAKANIQGMFTIRLGEAPFDQADKTLARLAGPCTTCSKRAGNDPDLRAELAADVCTDAGCYGAKVQAHAERRIAELKAQGARVLTGDAARGAVVWGKPPHINLRGFSIDHHCGWVGGKIDLNADEVIERLQAAGQQCPAPVYIQHHETGELMRCWAQDDWDTVQAAMDRLMGATGPGAHTPSTAGAGANPMAHRDEELAQWTEAERVWRDRNQCERVRRAILLAVRGLVRSLDDLRIMAKAQVLMGEDFRLVGELFGIEAEHRAALDAADAAGEDFDSLHWYYAWIDRAGADDLAAVLVAMAVDDMLPGVSISDNSHHGRTLAANAVALAERYGVDVVAAARPEQMDDAGVAGDSAAARGQIDAFAAAEA